MAHWVRLQTVVLKTEVQFLLEATEIQSGFYSQLRVLEVLLFLCSYLTRGVDRFVGKNTNTDYQVRDLGSIPAPGKYLRVWASRGAFNFSAAN